MFRIVALTAVLVCSAIAAAQDRHAVEVVDRIDVARPDPHASASESTALLPFELSAVRLRPRSQNRWA